MIVSPKVQSLWRITQTEARAINFHIINVMLMNDDTEYVRHMHEALT